MKRWSFFLITIASVFALHFGLGLQPGASSAIEWPIARTIEDAIHHPAPDAIEWPIARTLHGAQPAADAIEWPIA